jgi:endonuclease-8
MPEGPSIVILREQVAPFVGRKVQRVEGNSKLDLQRMRGQRVTAFQSWGKHFLIRFPRFAMRVHFMLFGSYRINERREAVPRMSLVFANGELNFYACSLKYIEGDLAQPYDWEADVMADEWNPRAARRNSNRSRQHWRAMRCSINQSLRVLATLSRTKRCFESAFIRKAISARCHRAN